MGRRRLRKSAVFAIYDTHEEAEQAVRELERSGFDMQKLSIVGKDYQTEEDVVGYYTAGDRMMSRVRRRCFGKRDMGGLLFGSAFFLIPGIGPLLAGPADGRWIVGAPKVRWWSEALSALGAGLYGLGIPKDSIIEYETQIKAGKYVVITHGSPDEVSKTEGTLSATKHQGLKKHSCCA